MIRLGPSICVAAILMAQSANALSCSPPNPASHFNEMVASPKRFHVSVGTVTYLDKIPAYKDGVDRSVRASVSGQFMGKSVLGDVKEFDITFNATCLASWCGGYPETGTKIVAFIEAKSNGMHLASGPCRGDFYSAQVGKITSLFQKCMKHGKCSASDVRKFRRP